MRITEYDYDKFYNSFRDKIVEVDADISLQQQAEDGYYLSVKYMLELANRAFDLFESSEVEERRQLIKLVLSNVRIDGSLVKYDVLKPFDTIANYADRSSWGRLPNDVRTYFSNISIVEREFYKDFFSWYYPI